MTVVLIALAVLAAGGLLAAAPVREGVRRAGWLYRPPWTSDARPPKTTLELRAGSVDRDIGPALATWTVHGRGPHTVVVSHPVGRQRAAVLAHAELLHRAGYHVVLYGLRNHGESGTDPEPRHMAAKLTADLGAVLTAVRGDPTLGRGRVGVLALSFSTWPAIHLLRDAAAPVDAIACDSGPGLDIAAAMRRYFALQRRLLPRPLRAAPAFHVAQAAFVLAARWRLGVRGWPPDLTRERRPLLFVAAGRDELIPPDQVRAVAECAPTARFWVAPRAIHVNALRLERAAYAEQLTDFFAEAFAMTSAREPGSG